MTTARAASAARAAWVVVALVAIGSTLAARRGLVNKSEMEPHLPRAAVPTPPPLAVKLPPPTPAEVDGTLRRVFGDAVSPATGPALVGDFNGDGAQDIAAPVLPSPGRLPEINGELALWQLQDAQVPPLDVAVHAGGEPPLGTRIQVEASDALLAVVHGVGERGWRDTEARQAYLVRRAIGAPLEAHPRTDLTRYVKQVPENARLEGDIIFSTAGGRAGFVYWTGYRYAWHALPSRTPTVASAR